MVLVEVDAEHTYLCIQLLSGLDAREMGTDQVALSERIIPVHVCSICRGAKLRNRKEHAQESARLCSRRVRVNV